MRKKRKYGHTILHQIKSWWKREAEDSILILNLPAFNQISVFNNLF